jgi:PAS domain S-box-containing protein
MPFDRLHFSAPDKFQAPKPSCENSWNLSVLLVGGSPTLSVRMNDLCEPKSSSSNMKRSLKTDTVSEAASFSDTVALFLCFFHWRSVATSPTAVVETPTKSWLVAGFVLAFAALVASWMYLAARAAVARSHKPAEDEYPYRELCDSSLSLIAMLSHDGKFLYTNLAARQALGYTAEEIAQLSLEEVVSSERIPAMRQSICELLAGDPRRSRFESRYRTKSGEVLQLQGTVSCRQHKGKPILMTIHQDVGARNQAEQELRELEERLQFALEKERELARVDPLTHVSNRRAFYEQADLEIARVRRYSRPLCVAYMDIDDFKIINDTL